MDLSRVALEQRLGDSARGAKVAVDLKRRVGIEQVGYTPPCVTVSPLSTGASMPASRR